MVVVAAGPGGGHKILLISGKHSSQLGATEERFKRTLSVVLPPSGSQASSDSDSNGSGAAPRKRQRLTHLSPEEKSLRRKLKNRVAAQTARDRKKAKMGELEQQVLELELENQKLHMENRLLREQTHSLMTENQQFRERLGLDALRVEEKVQMVPSGVDTPGMVIGSSESAEGAGPAVIKAEGVHLDFSTDGLSIADSESDVLLGLLDVLEPEFLRCDSLDPRTMAEQAAVEPIPFPTYPGVGAPPAKLEANNELIHWDHIYTRLVEVEVASTEQREESNLKVKMANEDESEVAAVVETSPIKEEPEEEEELVSTIGVGDFNMPGSPEETYFTEADSGYESPPSPFSSMSSPIWDDIFATELFPQLISV